MEVPQLYSVLYFFMLLMLGIGSMLGNTAAILTPLTDSKVIGSRFPKEVISGRHLPGCSTGHTPSTCVCLRAQKLGCPTAIKGPSLTSGGAGNSKYAAGSVCLPL